MGKWAEMKLSYIHLSQPKSSSKKLLELWLVIAIAIDIPNLKFSDIVLKVGLNINSILLDK